MHRLFDGDTALELVGVNAYDVAVLDREIPGPSGDEIAGNIVAFGSGMPVLMPGAAATTSSAGRRSTLCGIVRKRSRNRTRTLTPC